MTAFLMGEGEREALRRVRALAEAEPQHMPTVAELLKTPEGRAQHAARIAQRFVVIPVDFEVMFTVETGHPVGPCRHMSMSTGNRERIPVHEAVLMVMEELGFVGGTAACEVWQETIPAGRRQVHLIQPLMPATATAAKPCPTLGPSCRGCPDCQGIPPGAGIVSG